MHLWSVRTVEASDDRGIDPPRAGDNPHFQAELHAQIIEYSIMKALSRGSYLQGAA